MSTKPTETQACVTSNDETEGDARDYVAMIMVLTFVAIVSVIAHLG